MKNKKQKDYHAKLVIHDLPEMKKVEYQRLIKWLEKTAKNLKEENDQKIYSKTFTERLMK